MDWQIETLAPAFIQRARSEGLDALEQPVRRLAAQGGEPLRDALRRARPGEALILASYSPFRLDGPYREFGPVFLAAEPQTEALPRLDALLAGPGYFRDAPALRAYDAGQSMLEAVLPSWDQLAERLRQWQARVDIAFAMLRFPAHGCYALRLNRER